MVRREDVETAAGELLSAALLGHGWEAALQRLAEAAEAGGATLVHFRDGNPLAMLSSTGWAEADAALAAGRVPRSRLRYFPDYVYGRGFRVDHHVWSDEQMRRDPYFQEFLRPRGVLFHARARLSSAPGGRISISLKRRLGLGAYEPLDVAVLDSALPQLRAAARIARHVLDAQASSVLQVLGQRGEPVFELDAWGRVLRLHGNDTEPYGLLVRNRQLVAVDRLAQPALDRAIAAAVTQPQRPALAAIVDQRGKRAFLQIAPVAGGARDVFLATAAIAVVIRPRPRPAPGGLLPDAIREALGLTAREAQIAQALAEGLSLTEAARRLCIQIGTARNHLKSIFEKSGARRQGELVALLCKLKF